LTQPWTKLHKTLRTVFVFFLIAAALFPMRLRSQETSISSAGDLSPSEKKLLASLHIDSHTAAKRVSKPRTGTLAQRGKMFFEDRAFSGGQDTSCADCHMATSAYASPRLLGSRSVPTLYGAALWRFLNWDGSADSLEAQAFGPLTSQVEMNSSCAHVTKILRTKYKIVMQTTGQKNAEDLACALFLSDLAAYVETLSAPPPAPIDVFTEALRRETLSTLDPTFDAKVLAGAKLFAGKGLCAQCHNGPLVSDGEFHNVGVPSQLDESPAQAAGRIQGMVALATNPFRCETCEEWQRLPIGRHFALGAFKTPTLRQLGLTPPYMHNGLYDSIEAAVRHYSLAPDPIVGDSELARISLSDAEIKALTAFLQSLTSFGGAPNP
jgi:cytochrome c peroxidase